MFPTDRDDSHKVQLDLSLELVFKDESRMQPNEATVEAYPRKDGEPVSLGYRLIGVNVLKKGYSAEIAPLVSSTRWASVTTFPFEHFAERFEIGHP
jgi:hypothetical protein